ncbi:MAG TPA: amino acid adenylation domain-containing protein [Acidimicrobiia bacterium]|jgi:amino acid adenylation domain-containing protein|nr:amino acid adenylation domain-containing protein [Acidimicrobiia bacterium]
MAYRYLVHQYLEDSAVRVPDKSAVVDQDRSLTYAELNARANQVARLLQSLGVRKGDRVGIYMRKSLESVVGIYGAMKAGAAYVPLDPSAPTHRIGYITGNCGIRVILTGREKRRAWKEVKVEGAADLEHFVVLNIDEIETEVPGVTVHTANELDRFGIENLEVPVVQQDLAYILYTSGSTGDPKGVMLSHLACRGFVEWAGDEYTVVESDVLSSHAPLHFDLSTFDLYAASRAGATLVLVPPKYSVFPIEIANFIDTHQITVWYSVPSILTMLVEHANLEVGALPSIRELLFAGEVFPTKYLSRLMKLAPHARFSNLYGPTETNVCTAYTVPEAPPEDGPTISIGKAISNVETFVVDEHGNEVEKGQVGELLVRGPTLLRGYWGDAERTRSRLVPDPRDPEFGDPVYHTGDLVEELEDGNYRFLGRRDHQIKHRGYRIELGDIETAINAHPDVVECAVVPVPDEFVSNRIKAFVAVKAEIPEVDMINHCSGLVQKYMIPEDFYFRENLPKTSRGKIDRTGLQSEAIELHAVAVQE